MFKETLIHSHKETLFSPGWCGLPGWSIVLWTKRLWVQFPSQGRYPGFGFDPKLGCVQEGNQSMFISHFNVSFSLSLSPSCLVPLKAVKKVSLGED